MIQPPPTLTQRLAERGVDVTDPQQLLMTVITALHMQCRQLLVVKRALAPDKPPTLDEARGLGDACLLIADELSAAAEMLAALQR